MIYNEIRPYTWDAMIGQEAVRKILSKQCAVKKTAHAYVLHGSRGCGKTTSARILARALNCKHVDEAGNPCGECPDCVAITQGCHVNVTEVDAARNRGVDYADRLISDTMFAPIEGKKVYIIDEAHMLSKEAVNALLKVMEEPPEWVCFILCTTDLNALPATIKSRAQVFNYTCVDEDDVGNYLCMVCCDRNISYEEDAIRMIAQESGGGVRDALSILERCMVTGLDVETVRVILGHSDTRLRTELLRAICVADIPKVKEQLDLILKQVAANVCVSELQKMVTDISLRLIGDPKAYEAYEEFRKITTPAYLAKISSLLGEISSQIRTASFPNIVLTSSLIGFLSETVEEMQIKERIEKIERKEKELEELIKQLNQRYESAPVVAAPIKVPVPEDISPVYGDEWRDDSDGEECPYELDEDLDEDLKGTALGLNALREFMGAAAVDNETAGEAPVSEAKPFPECQTDVPGEEEASGTDEEETDECGWTF